MIYLIEEKNGERNKKENKNRRFYREKKVKYIITNMIQLYPFQRRKGEKYDPALCRQHGKSGKSGIKIQ